MGTGTLDNTRAGEYGSDLTGDQDIFGKAFNATHIAVAQSQASPWTGGPWTGSQWTGDRWDGHLWSTATWTGNTGPGTVGPATPGPG